MCAVWRWTSTTGRSVSDGCRAPPATDPRCAGTCQRAPEVVALAVELHTHPNGSLPKVAPLLRRRGSGCALRRTAWRRRYIVRSAIAVPAYTALCDQLRNAPVVTPDEYRLARRRRAPLAVGVHHPGHRRLRHLPQSRARRRRHRPRDRLQRRAPPVPVASPSGFADALRQTSLAPLLRCR